MVRTAGEPAAPGNLNDLPEPTWRSLLERGLPTFAVEGLLPLLVFYGTLSATGLGPAIVASTGVCAAVVAWQLRRGHDFGVAVVTLVFLSIQAVVGVAAHSATIYLAQPVVLSGLWGIACLASVAVGRPLIGVFANAWYPFPAWFRASEPYRREFGMQSLVWGVYCLARAGLRLAVLLTSGVGGFVLVSAATGMPVIVALILWGIRHARRAFVHLSPVDLA